MADSKKLFLTKKRRLPFPISVLLLTGLMVAILTFPQAGYGVEKLFRLSDEPTEGNSVFTLPDGYLILANHRGQQNFTKFDLNGDEQFSIDFYDAKGGWPRSAVQTHDGGYLIAGLIDTTPRKGYLIKVNQNLNLTWGKEFSEKGSVWVGSAKETSDGGYIVLARGDHFVEVIKLKSDGSLDWQKRILTGGQPEVVDLHETSDGYVICGRVYNTSNHWNLYLAAIGKEGTALLWQWMIRGAKVEGKSIENDFTSPGVSNIIQLDTDHLALAASAVSTGNNWSTLLIPFNPTGVVGRIKSIEGSGGNWVGDPHGGPNFIRLPDGSLLLSGYARALAAEKPLPYLVKLQPNIEEISGQYVYGREGNGILGLADSGSNGVVATGVGGELSEDALLLGFDESMVTESLLLMVPSPEFTLRDDLSVETIEQSAKLDDGMIKIAEISTIKSDAIVTSITPGSIAFGTTCAAQTVSQFGVFKNDNQLFRIQIDQITSADATIFRLLEGGTCYVGAILDPNQSCLITIGFTPPLVSASPFTRTYSSSLSVRYLVNPGSELSSSQTESMNLSGTGVQNDISLTPTVTPPSVNFGSICAGTSSDQTITIRNDGACPIALGAIGTASGAFSRVGGTCQNGQTLDAGGSCSISVRFTPPSEASPNSSFSSSLSFSYNIFPNIPPFLGAVIPPLPTVTINLTGTKGQQAIAVSPPSVNFGDTCVTGPSTQTVTVRNTGTCPLTLGTIGTPAAPFGIAQGAGSCSSGQTLNSGGSCSIQVTFIPTETGTFTSALTISSNDPNTGVVNVALSGTAGGTGAPHITVNPSSGSFGSLCLPDSSEQTFTVQNAGTCPLALGTIGAPAPPFSIVQGTGSCSSGQTLGAGGGCSITVRFAPSQTGSFTSSLIIRSNDPNSGLINVTLSGTGGKQKITVTPTDVDLGIVKENETSERTITVANPGSCPLNILTLGVPSAPFRIGGGTCTPGKTLRTGESCSIIVGFSPTEAGAFTSSFNISADDPDVPTVTVHLRGGSGTDLTGEWISSERQCNETARGVRCTVKATFNVMNIGTGGTPPVCVRFFLSRDGKLDQGVDTLLTQMETNSINAGKSETMRLRVTLPPGDSGSGGYIIALVDCTNCVTEANEVNNIIALPLQ